MTVSFACKRSDSSPSVVVIPISSSCLCTWVLRLEESSPHIVKFATREQLSWLYVSRCCRRTSYHFASRVICRLCCWICQWNISESLICSYGTDPIGDSLEFRSILRKCSSDSNTYSLENSFMKRMSKGPQLFYFRLLNNTPDVCSFSPSKFS